MNEKVKRLLDNQGGNYIFPFFWQHGESEEVLRKYMRVIHDSNIGAVCVESRPHPDFCGEKWWQDMDVILDEARRMDMKVWILDDSHFPTGFANGALEGKPDDLCRQSICCRKYQVKAGETLHMNADEVSHPDPFVPDMIETHVMGGASVRKFDDDRLLSLCAARVDGEERVDLCPFLKDGELDWKVPDGEWKVYALHLSRNFGTHRSYINMMDRRSCRLLIDAVYEPHYAHYSADFGKTIAGFFSDEPELGNGHMYAMDDPFGSDIDYPWSAELEEKLREKFGEELGFCLPLLWEQDGNAAATAKVRYAYMDALTKLVREDFSEQVGSWCREHNVQYIGHLIEDDNHHSRTGCSLGHYFRGLAGQDMSGIDDIGGQVFPQGEELSYNNGPFAHRNGEFYHYLLGKLASSAAAIEPRKQGRAMCEIFGNYGWEEGVRLEKYLADHFMVRGVNRYVPHAFTPKEFPDPDCPPHFYAHGHNPQYRHFGCLMSYMNRVCELISDGRHVAPVAVLYHGEGDWTGRCMTADQVGHVLCDAQIEYDVIPQDVFAEREEYRTVIADRVLRVNTQEYRAVVVPGMQFVTSAFAAAVAELDANGVQVIFVGEAPEGLCDTVDGSLVWPEAGANTLLLSELVASLRKNKIPELEIAPADDRVRYYHYIHEDGSEVFYFVNEGTKEYCGTAKLLDRVWDNSAYIYDAWENAVRPISVVNGEIALALEPLKSMIVVLDASEGQAAPAAGAQGGRNGAEFPSVAASAGDTRNTAASAAELAGTASGTHPERAFSGPWKRSLCRGIDYPAFGEEKEILLPDTLAEEEPLFSGFARYENTFEAKADETLVLEITDAYEGVEVFLNGKSLGIQIVPVYRFGLTGSLRDGVNELRIEVATTLEREMSTIPDRFGRTKEPKGLSGITGEVKLYTRQ